MCTMKVNQQTFIIAILLTSAIMSNYSNFVMMCRVTFETQSKIQKNWFVSMQHNKLYS